VEGNLDGALAETVTLAADDVLLDDLLARLDDQHLARSLLLGAAVYRLPVDLTGLVWQIGEEFEPAAEDPHTVADIQALLEAAKKAQAEGKAFDPTNVGLDQARLQAAMQTYQTRSRPPINPPAGLDQALERLQQLSLLTPFQSAGEETEGYMVHRWTAAALNPRTPPEVLGAAHHKAARYWRWRAKTLPQPREQDIQDWLEARHHHHAAGELAEAIEVTEGVALQLDTWGAWDWEERPCRETLAWLPANSEKSAAFYCQISNFAYLRGDYEEALNGYHEIITIFEKLGNRAGMASSLSQMGVLFTETGRPAEGVSLNLQSLVLRLELQVPQVRIDLHWLGRQREALGEAEFHEVLLEHLDEESAKAVLGMLGQYNTENAGSDNA